MPLVGSPIPTICITPAPPEVIYPDPYSPFAFQTPDAEDDGYRANRLSLPSLPPCLDQFTSLLKVSRDQRAQKVTDVHKKPVLENQRSLKQLSLETVERRARFLSKLSGPCHTAAISIPNVPPSPCGFKSEYSALEIAVGNSMDAVVVNPHEPAWDIEAIPPIKSIRIPPSLDEITARLKPVKASSELDHPPPRLPDLLSPAATDHQIKSLPVRALALNSKMFDTQQLIRSERPRPSAFASGSRHAVVSHTANIATGPTLHTIRADTARDMVVILKRRSSPPPDLGRYGGTRAITEVKRCSTPARLQHGGRVVLVAQ